MAPDTLDLGQTADPTITTSSSSHSSTSASYMYRDALLKLGSLSPTSWPSWAQLLPKVVAGYSGVAGAEWYLTGTIKRPKYAVADMPTVLGDPTKRKEYEQWVKLADGLKMVVATYGGADAAARVNRFETRLGDAPGLWKKLEESYGMTETGAERIVQLAAVHNNRWDEVTPPAIWLASLREKQQVVNSSYEADAKLAPDQEDRNTIADRNAAVSDNVLRDLIMGMFLPPSYAEVLQPSVNRKTTLDDLQNLIVNLHATRISRETIAGMESARRVAPAPSPSATPAPTPTPQHSQQQQWRGGRGRRARGGPKLAATRYANFERWRGGTFKDANGTTRFKVPPGTCFACFKSDGHLARDCPTSDQARSRVEEMRKDGISVPMGEAMALMVLDLNPSGEMPDGAAIAAFRAMAIQADHYPLPPRPASTPASFRVLAEDVDPHTPAFAHAVDVLPSNSDSPSLDSLAGLRTFTSAPVNDDTTPSVGRHVFDGDPLPDHALRTTAPSPVSDYILDSGATRHFTTRLDHLHDYKPYASPHPVGGAFGSAGHALGEGTVVLTFPSGPVAITNVMYVPGLGVNLLSQTRLMMAGMRFSNDRARMFVKDEAGRPVMDLAVGPTLKIKASAVSTTEDKIVAFQSDNGTEFVNQTLDGFLSQAGIQHRRTVPYVHGQNGFVERRWRSLLETTRTLLCDSGLPLSFWPYALQSATYLYNRSPTSSLPSSQTPFEAYHGTPPDLSNLRAWGCVAYLRLSPEGRSAPHKLEDRGVRARFVGYPEDSKGWLFWVPEQRKIVVGWNARFVEDEFSNERTQEDEDRMERWMGEMDEMAGTEDGERTDEADRPPREEEEDARRDRRADEEEEEAEEHQEEEEQPERETDVEDEERGEGPPPPSPTPPPPPPPRRSTRLAGMEGDDLPFYRPLDGAPARDPPPLNDLALSTFAPAFPTIAPLPQPLLAFATHAHDLDSDPESSISFAFDCDAAATGPALRSALEQALATGPSWNGSLDEPSYRQAMAGPDVEKWTSAMDAELAAFEATGTWEESLVDLPAGRHAIAVKWVLLVKRDADGKVIKYKARLVARGDMQVEGVDFDETFSSTVRLTTVRLVLSLLAAHPHWQHRQFDISNAYLLGTLDNEIYIKQPPGFIDSTRPTAVRRLKKALYGLRQGGREWQKVLRAALEKVGFRRTSADHGLYVRRRNGRVAIIPTHVDDGMMVGDDDLDGILDRLSEELEGKLKKVGTELFLGMRVTRKADGTVEADQAHYTRTVLDRFFPTGLTPRTTPLDADYGNVTPATEDERFPCQYRELLGALVYLSACTRPDIAFALSFASRFATCPAERHWRLLVRLCRYLTATTDLGLRYSTPLAPFSPDLVTGWSDADHGADKESRRSISGFVFGVGDDTLRSTAISWLSRRQRSVAISSTEAEYMALSEAAREAIWLRSLLVDLGFPPTSPTTIRGDNSGSLLLSSHPTSHSRTKHIAVHYHFTRDQVEEGTLVLKWVPTDEMVADVFTKGLGGVKHTLFTARCGLRDVRREGGCREVDDGAATMEEKKGRRDDGARARDFGGGERRALSFSSRRSAANSRSPPG
ncbi:hypothetical protein JCM5296_000533 [Sporobolomyces johnsonii]